MSTVLLLCSLFSQCPSDTLYYDVRYDGPIYSKKYVQAVIDGTRTEVPIVNGLVPNIKIIRSYGAETRIFTYNCGTRYDGNLIKYVNGDGCAAEPTPAPEPAPEPIVAPRVRQLPQLPSPRLVPPASLPLPLPQKKTAVPLPLPDDTSLDKQFIGDLNIKVEREITPNY
jgi:hypothetical protein